MRGTLKHYILLAKWPQENFDLMIDIPRVSDLQKRDGLAKKDRMPGATHSLLGSQVRHTFINVDCVGLNDSEIRSCLRKLRERSGWH